MPQRMNSFELCKLNRYSFQYSVISDGKTQDRDVSERNTSNYGLNRSVCGQLVTMHK